MAISLIIFLVDGKGSSGGASSWGGGGGYGGSAGGKVAALSGNNTQDRDNESNSMQSKTILWSVVGLVSVGALGAAVGVCFGMRRARNKKNTRNGNGLGTNEPQMTTASTSAVMPEAAVYSAQKGGRGRSSN